MIWTLTFSRIWLAEKFSLIFPSDNHCILNRPCAVRCNIFTSCHFGRVLPQRACHTRFICDRGIDFDFVESVWPKSAEAKIDRKDWLISLRSESVDLKRRSAYSTKCEAKCPSNRTLPYLKGTSNVSRELFDLSNMIGPYRHPVTVDRNWQLTKWLRQSSRVAPAPETCTTCNRSVRSSTDLSKQVKGIFIHLRRISCYLQETAYV